MLVLGSVRLFGTQIRSLLIAIVQATQFLDRSLSAIKFFLFFAKPVRWVLLYVCCIDDINKNYETYALSTILIWMK